MPFPRYGFYSRTASHQTKNKLLILKKLIFIFFMLFYEKLFAARQRADFGAYTPRQTKKTYFKSAYLLKLLTLNWINFTNGVIPIRGRNLESKVLLVKYNLSFVNSHLT